MPTNIIDDEVVRMSFDNAKFEKGIKQSTDSLAKFKDALQLKGAEKGLEEVERTMENMSFDSVTRAIDKVSDKFTYMEYAAKAAIENITNRFTDMAVTMAKSLSIDNISSGWAKYEQQTEAVQTIMNATGKSIEEVSEEVNKLMIYTDETSYRFTDMLGSIASFTSQGIELKEARIQMQGIANWAALSGVNAAGASRAMQQLAQGIGKGYLQVQDWQSIETLHMDTEEFKKIAIAVAEMEGTIKKGDVTISNFRNTLSKKWFTKDVLSKALNQYGEFYEAVYQAVEVDGKYDTFSESIAGMGDQYAELGVKAFKAAQEAKTFTDVIGSVQEAVSSKWMRSFELIFGNYEEAKVLWTNMANELWEIFASGGDTRNDLLEEAFGNLGGRQNLADGIMNLVYALGEFKSAISDSFGRIFNITSDKIYNLTESFLEFTKSLRFSEEQLDRFGNILDGVLSVVKLAIKTMTTIGGVGLDILKSLSPLFDKILDKLSEFSTFLTTIAESASVGLGDMSKTFKTIGSYLKSSFTGIISKASEALEKFFGILDISNFNNLANNISTILTNVWNGIVKFFSNINIKDLFDVGIKGALTAWLVAVTGTLFEDLQWLADIFINSFRGATQTFGEILVGLSDTLSSYWDESKVGQIKAIAQSLLMLSGALFILSSIEPGRLQEPLTMITILLGEVVAAVKLLSSGTAFKPGKGIAGIFEELFGVFAQSAKIAAIIPVISTLGNALLKIAAALAVVSFINPERLMPSVAALSAMIWQLVLIFKLLSTNKGAFEGAARSVIKTLSTSLIKIAAALTLVSFANQEGLASGFVALSLILWQLVGSFSILNENKKLFTGNITKIVNSLGDLLIKLSVSLGLLSFANQESLASSFLMLSLMLWEMVGAFNVLSTNSNSITKSSKVVSALGNLMLKLSAALMLVSLISGKKMVQSIVALSSMLVVLTACMQLLDKLDISKTTVAAIGVLASSMLVLSAALGILSLISSGSLITSLLGLAGALTILIGSAFLLQKLNLGLMLTTLGRSVAMFGGGILALGAGLVAINLALMTFGSAIRAVLQDLEGIVVDIVNFVKVLVIALANMIIEVAPKLVEVVISLVTTVLKGVKDAITQWGPLVFEIVLEALELLRIYIPQLVSSLLETVVNIIIALADAIKDNREKVAVALENVVMALVSIVVELLFDALEGLASMLLPGLATKLEEAKDSINGFFDTAIDENKGRIAGETATESISDGLDSKIDLIEDSANDLAKETYDSYGSQENIGSMNIAGVNVSMGAVSGILSQYPVMYDAGYGLGQQASAGYNAGLKIASPSRVMMESGKFTVMGLVKGIEEYSKYATEASGEVGDGVMDSLRDSIMNISQLLSSDVDLNPTITPVLDLSNVKSGIGQLSSMMSNDHAYSIQNGMNNVTDTVATERSGNIVFNQYNNSPKALSAIDIYRRTNSQLATLKMGR